LEELLVDAIFNSPKSHGHTSNLKVCDSVMGPFCELQREMKLTPYLYISKRWAPPGCRFRTGNFAPECLTEQYIKGESVIWTQLQELDDDAAVTAFTESLYRENDEHPQQAMEVLEEQDLQEQNEGDRDIAVVDLVADDVVDEVGPTSCQSGQRERSSRKRRLPGPGEPGPSVGSGLVSL
jgi:hypothetical protein